MSDLAARVRDLLDVPTVEKRMFGGVSFLVDDAMLLSVRGSGDLLVRVDPARSPELVDGHGASRTTMGRRSMGPSWLTVPADRLADDEQLRFWLDLALEYHRSR
ncbi:TfoX/Sxy family protein [Actinomycetospora chiangmaiensis]|uniref:TfoX/Sxy family protein n=1 Tax=Actinomycetospora chiangmaiensis TaxID=402650 RepID=UPI00037D3C57|nr:TfoX/Sxy family protein [Actinomycetospora chiangmaiensis]